MSISIDYQQSPQSDVAPFVAARILEQLEQGKSVLWLLSGGSGGAVCVEASKVLAEHDLSNLYVTMSDERYGPIDHPDENVRQLLDGGLMLPDAMVYRPLIGARRDETTAAFGAWLQTADTNVDYRIATLGIGADGHTCGIKPHSIAVSSTDPAASFTGEDFERLTITANFLRSLDEAVVQAYGDDKHAVVQRLLNGDGAVDDYPMLAIRNIPRVTVFSNYQKEKTS